MDSLTLLWLSNEYGINTVERMSHFIGQIGFESDRLNELDEVFTYTARRTVEVFGLAKYGHIFNEQVFDESTKTYSLVPVNFNCTKCEGGNSNGKPEEGSANFTTRYKNRTEVANAYADTLKKVNEGKPDEHEKYADRSDIVHNGPNKNQNNLEEKGIEKGYNDGKLQIKDKYLGKKALFDVVYSCRNGNINSKDGSRYKGAGFIHLTGKDNYKKVYDIWKSKHPDHKTIKNLEDFAEALKTNVEIAAEASMIYWNSANSNGLNGNILADLNNYKEVTKFVNGGTTDWEKRKKIVETSLKELNK